MTYSTHTTTRTDNGWLPVILSLAYALVIGAVAYAVPLAEILHKVTQ